MYLRLINNFKLYTAPNTRTISATYYKYNNYENS